MLTFRRRIGIFSIGTPASGEARSVLEDDFHHFRVRVQYRDGRVVRVEGTAVRNPYSTCPLAAGQLSQLLDMPLDAVANSVTRVADARNQCTHMLDLAGLAIAAAARSIPERWYDIAVPRRVAGRTRARLDRDGAPLLEWDVHDSTILGPAPYAGISLREGLSAWALATLAQDEAEAALVLRRCVLISLGRTKDLDAQVHAIATGHCFVQQPARAAQSLRIVGSTWDFTHTAAALCADDHDWLAFRDGKNP